MNKWTIGLALSLSVISIPCTLHATYLIIDDATGGDCTTIGFWDSATKTCTLTTDLINVEDPGITIGDDNITLDGNNHRLEDQNGIINDTGVVVANWWPGRSNVSVRNLKIAGFTTGIYGNYLQGGHITENTIVDANFAALRLRSSSGTVVENNDISGSWNAMRIENSSAMNFIGNFVHHSDYGILLYITTDSLVQDNYIFECKWGLLFSGAIGGDGNQYGSDHNIAVKNTIENSNQYGLHMALANYSTVFNNNFINYGSLHIIEEFGGFVSVGNVFNLDAPEGGNYWDTYDEPIEGCSDIDSNGFCDVPFVFIGGEDLLPLTGPILDDSDGDGVPDDDDNCPAIANPDQADLDGDQIGDLCDEVMNVDGGVSTLQQMVAGLGLDAGLANSLQAKLASALISFHAGDLTDAVGQLSAFINQVEAKRGKEFSNTEADSITAAAQAIIDAIIGGTAV